MSDNDRYERVRQIFTSLRDVTLVDAARYGLAVAIRKEYFTDVLVFLDQQQAALIAANALAEKRGLDTHDAQIALFAANARIKELVLERDLAVAHDTQPYPTAEAYEKVCAALYRRDGMCEWYEDRLLAFDMMPWRNREELRAAAREAVK